MSAEHIDYLDFELRIAGQAGSYSAHVYASPGGQASTSVTIPLSPDRLELLILRLSRIRGAARRIDSPEMAAARELGGALFQAVFQGGVRDVLRSSLEIQRKQPDSGLRIKLRLQDAPELASLPWEFLYDADMRRFLAQSVYTPVVRYIEAPESILPLRTALPLRILAMVAAPSDCAPLDAERERYQVEQALAPLVKTGQVEITWLEQATLNALRRGLRAKEYHIFHFTGHGGFNAQTQQGVLLFENDMGSSVQVDADRLGVVLHDRRSLRLAVLNACEGAHSTTADPFAGVATTLALQGLPAVLAMQFAISDRAAVACAGEFYSALAQGLAVDSAVAEARKAIYTDISDVEWGTPVLFLRAADGVLFEVEEPAADPRTGPGEPDRKKVAAPPGEEKAPQQHDTAQPPATKKKAPASKPGRTINTGGGAYIEGNVNTGGGDFIGRDQVVGQGRKPRRPATASRQVIEPELVTVPEGEFWMGSGANDKNAEDDEKPRHRVWLDGYQIGRCPVTVAQFRAFCLRSHYETTAEVEGDERTWWERAGDRSTPGSRDQHPVAYVSWNDAAAYCRWLSEITGKPYGLPTEAQWEKAARGTDERLYAWGSTPPNRMLCNLNQWFQDTTPVGKFSPAGDSPYGCADMTGNVWEWCADFYEESYYQNSLAYNPTGPETGVLRALRGGSWLSDEKPARCACRDSSFRDFRRDNLGFRVVML